MTRPGPERRALRRQPHGLARDGGHPGVAQIRHEDPPGHAVDREMMHYQQQPPRPRRTVIAPHDLQHHAGVRVETCGRRVLLLAQPGPPRRPREPRDRGAPVHVCRDDRSDRADLVGPHAVRSTRQPHTQHVMMIDDRLHRGENRRFVRFSRRLQQHRLIHTPNRSTARLPPSHDRRGRYVAHRDVGRRVHRRLPARGRRQPRHRALLKHVAGGDDHIRRGARGSPAGSRRCCRRPGRRNRRPLRQTRSRAVRRMPRTTRFRLRHPAHGSARTGPAAAARRDRPCRDPSEAMSPSARSRMESCSRAHASRGASHGADVDDRGRDRHDVTHQSPRSRRIVDDHGRRLRDAWTRMQRGFDVAEFNPEAAHLHLMVRAAEELELSICAPSRQITRAIEPCARAAERNGERIGDERAAVMSG